jgi:hypothetical protein
MMTCCPIAVTMMTRMKIPQIQEWIIVQTLLEMIKAEKMEYLYEINQ